MRPVVPVIWSDDLTEAAVVDDEKNGFSFG